jgi:hypothetical protein
VRDPDRKGKVESGVGHAKKTPLKGLRFESLEDAQTYLDRWEERWADTRIHGTTKEVPRVRFECEERHRLMPLAQRPYHSLVLLGAKRAERPKRTRLPSIAVERRPLSTYAQVVGGAA